MNEFVLDCSVTMSWFFKDEVSNYADQVHEKLTAGSIAYVPSIWPLEVTNVFLIVERQKRIHQWETTKYQNLLRKFPIRVQPVPTNDQLDFIFQIAREYKMTAYDASYLELAIRKQLPIATLDKKIKAAAEHEAVTVL